MKKFVQIALIVALLGLGFWGWRVFFPGPEKAIRSRLAKLAETMSFEPADGTLPKGLRAQRVPDFFTPDATLIVKVRNFGERTLSGRAEIQETAMGIMQTMRGLQIEFRDPVVTLGPDRQTGTVNLTGKATVAGERDYYVQEFIFQMKKVDGKWLIDRVETVETLE
jgi:hypothetical protein